MRQRGAGSSDNRPESSIITATSGFMSTCGVCVEWQKQRESGEKSITVEGGKKHAKLKLMHNLFPCFCPVALNEKKMKKNNLFSSTEPWTHRSASSWGRKQEADQNKTTLRPGPSLPTVHHVTSHPPTPSLHELSTTNWSIILTTGCGWRH